MDILYIYI